MRNILKPAARTASSRARRSVRGVAAVVASVALAAGLGSYPVEAQETETETVTATTTADPSTPPAESTTTNPVSAEPNSVTVERMGTIDRITVRDTDDNPWDSGRKASDEFIWGVKRIDDGDIIRIVSVTADGEELDPQYFGFVNGEDFDVIGIDEDAFSTIPPMKLEIEAETTAAGDYAIADPEEVPTARELSATGFGQTDQAAATVAPDRVGMARAASLPASKEQLTLNPLSYSVITGASGGKSPRGTLKTSVAGTRENRNFYLTELVINYSRSSEYNLSGPVEIRKNSNEKCVIQPENIRKVTVRTGMQISVDLTSCPYQIAVWKGSGDRIEVDFQGPGAAPSASYYSLELYGSYDKANQPTPTTSTPAPTTSAANPSTSPTAPSSSAAPTTEAQPTADAEPDPQGETTIEEGRFRVVAKTDPEDPITLSGIQTSGSNPYTTTATFDQRTVFSGAVIEANAPNGILATEQYGFNIDLLESGVKLDRRVISATSDSVVFEVFPVRDGQRIDSALVEKGATLTSTTRFADQPKNIDVTVTVNGTQVPQAVTDTTPITRPSGEQWLEKRIPNPELAEKCGLKVAIVADLSTSLKYADTNGFTASKQAASAMVDALAGTPTEVGIYHFSRTAGTDTNAVSVQDQQGVRTVKNAIAKWGETGQGSTNWEAGLKAVQNQNYDVVYFITDGMPTWDDTGWQRPGDTNTGAYVQERSLNQAIRAANVLKSDGTRIVPIMVDLRLKAGNVVTQDYVLKNVLPNGAAGSLNAGQPRFQRNGSVQDWSKLDRAVYKEPGNYTIVNLEEAQKANYWTFYMDGRNITNEQSKWTYGVRSVTKMGEDISGDGDTIRVSAYSNLETEMGNLAASLKEDCEGSITVRKRIVTSDGEVVVERASGWTFTATAGGNILDVGNATLVSSSEKTTGSEGAVKWRTVNADPATVSVAETRQDPYRIFKRDGANAVCSIRDAANSETSFSLPITNNGEDGINADIPAYSHVTCVFDNYEPQDEFVKLELEKLDATDNTTLSDAKFEVRSDREGDGPFPVTWDENSQTYKTEAKLATSEPYFLVETQAPTKDGQSYSLLVAPVQFQIVAGDGGYVVQIRDGEDWTKELVGAGLWTDRPQEFDAATGYLQVANVRQGDLPKTGGAGLQLPILFGGALIAAGALMGRRRVAA